MIQGRCTWAASGGRGGGGGGGEGLESLHAQVRRRTDQCPTCPGILVVWFYYLKLLMSALDFEPPYAGTLWRGVPKKLTGFPVCAHSMSPCTPPKTPALSHRALDVMQVGFKFRWWRFSSCTTDGKVLENPMFLGGTTQFRGRPASQKLNT